MFPYIVKFIFWSILWHLYYIVVDLQKYRSSEI